jgi:rhodanese-related sulfurtransferase
MATVKLQGRDHVDLDVAMRVLERSVSTTGAPAPRCRTSIRGSATKALALIAALLGVAVLTSCGGSSGSGGVQTVDPKAFLTTAGQQGTVVVDVRTPAEYAAGHIDGAVNIDVEASTFDAEIAKLDKSATYAVYCHSGRRSSLATDAMGTAGFTHVYNLSGGIADLASAGGQVVTS